jgi:hypothetical protein
MEIKFLKDYEWKDSTVCPPDVTGCTTGSQSFKKGDILEKTWDINISSDSKNYVIGRFGYGVVVPVEYLSVTDDNGKPVTDLEAGNADFIVKKYSNQDVAPETFLQKHKNHLLIAGALVIGYFAYKKFNK